MSDKSEFIIILLCCVNVVNVCRSDYLNSVPRNVGCM
jgi:hypothetical protein